MAIFCLFLIGLNWIMVRLWNAVSFLALAAAVLFLSPLVRAAALARGLPQELMSRLGSNAPREQLDAPARSSPLNYADLFCGVKSPAVQVTQQVYATVHGQMLSLDLFRPLKIDQPLPGVIVVHSGSWQSGDRYEFSDLSRYLAARGYLVASIDYRLAPGATFPAARDDVFSAITYLKAHANDIGLDKDHLVLLGRSAGGQIALSAAYAEKDPAIQGVIAFYSPNDLAWGYSIPGNPLIMNSQKVIATYLGGLPTQIPAVYDDASPLHAVNERRLRR